MLAFVELVVSPASSIERCVVASFHDTAALNDQDLIGRPNGRKAVSDDQGRAAAHQLTQPVLDEGLGFRIEARGGLVENQDSGIGQDRSGDRYTLALAAGQSYPALADDRFVLAGEALGKLGYMRDFAGLLDRRLAGGRA